MSEDKRIDLSEKKNIPVARPVKKRQEPIHPVQKTVTLDEFKKAPEEAPPAGPRKGKRSVRWDRDPEILARLETVASMMLENKSLRQIGAVFGYSQTTAKKDVERVYKLWLQDAEDGVDRLRAFSIGQYRKVQSEAWNAWANILVDKQASGTGLLRVIMDAESAIADLQGTEAPKKVDLVTEVVDPRELTDEQLAAIIAGGSRSRGS